MTFPDISHAIYALLAVLITIFVMGKQLAKQIVENERLIDEIQELAKRVSSSDTDRKKHDD